MDTTEDDEFLKIIPYLPQLTPDYVGTEALVLNRLSAIKQWTTEAVPRMNTSLLYSDLCPKTETKKHRMISHWWSIWDTKRYVACDLCDYQTNRIPHLEKHKLVHSKKNKRKICNKLVAAMKTHLRQAHAEPQRKNQT